MDGFALVVQVHIHIGVLTVARALNHGESNLFKVLFIPFWWTSITLKFCTPLRVPCSKQVAIMRYKRNHRLKDKL